ncbi:rhamnulokinase [Desmospora activa]|uniref:Rhamnulokinase n=1 Tax=Desmospora activa DSM 45169 TaxID=1121389 RepID=A0A2T4Z0Q7_9BACL|nr:rhamnulokinase family protein [Desmospora activa]PTM53290.1 rhamnulokinase [Desmospora activa DSM 45169]
MAWKGLAVDLGAASGRLLAGTFDGERLAVEEKVRFANEPVTVHQTMHWDFLRLFHHVKQGIRRVCHEGEPIASLGIDTWAVDFGLLDSKGRLLGNPVHYRDRRTDGIMEKVTQRIPRGEIFRETGIQFLPFNTVYQLAALKEANDLHLEQADTLLMIPDLFHYFLTGQKVTEYTNATTTQLFNPVQNTWSSTLLKALDISEQLFTDVVSPGSNLGKLMPAVAAELGATGINVIAVATHDTGSAVAAVPSGSQPSAYLCSGTWSLLGTEVDRLICSERALALNFTNEGGVEAFRFLKNIMGLWLLQEIKREWERQGKDYTWEEMTELMAEEPPFLAFVDPDDRRFLASGSMSDRIRNACSESGQPIPISDGSLLRTVTESLAFKYRWTLERLEELIGKKIEVLHMVGGGIQNRSLCQWTANACERPVVAGPVEASGIGNLLMQLLAAKEISSLEEGRRLVARSFPRKTYEPAQTERWDDHYERFQKVIR